MRHEAADAEGDTLPKSLPGRVPLFGGGSVAGYEHHRARGGAVEQDEKQKGNIK